MGLTRPPPAENWAAGIRMAKPTARKKRPKANFAGVDGSRLPMRSQSQAKTGASKMIQSEFTDCNCPASIRMPSSVRAVLFWAKRLSVEPACSNADQNTAAPRKSTKMTRCRLRSSRSLLPIVSSRCP